MLDVMTMTVLACAPIGVALAESFTPYDAIEQRPKQSVTVERQTDDTVKVVIGLTSSLEYPEAVIMVVRPAGTSAAPHLVITEKAEPADLARALHVLAYSYGRHGKVLQRELRTFITPSKARVSRQLYTEEARMLAAVRAALVDEEGPFRITRAASFLVVEREGRFRLASWQ